MRSCLVLPLCRKSPILPKPSAYHILGFCFSSIVNPIPSYTYFGRCGFQPHLRDWINCRSDRIENAKELPLNSRNENQYYRCSKLGCSKNMHSPISLDSGTMMTAFAFDVRADCRLAGFALIDNVGVNTLHVSADPHDENRASMFARWRGHFVLTQVATYC